MRLVQQRTASMARASTRGPTAQVTTAQALWPGSCGLPAASSSPPTALIRGAAMAARACGVNQRQPGHSPMTLPHHA